jgi:hypothetical protein
VKKSSLAKILIDWGRLFYDINLKNNGAIVIPQLSTTSLCFISITANEGLVFYFQNSKVVA